MDKGNEFAKEIQEFLANEYGIKRKIITSRNPQSNSMVERCHKTLGNMIDSLGIKDKRDLDPHFGFQGMLAALRKAMNATVHTTSRATPSQLVFGRDAILNVSFEADWQFIKDRKQKLILHNNKRENAKRKPHTYNVGDRVMVKADKQRKHGHDKYLGPYAVTQVNDNGTVKLVKVAENNNGGAVHETWNIRMIYPCMA